LASAHLPCLLFFDDFDAIANPHSVRVVNQLLISLERYWTAGDVIVVAAVNDLDLIDPALTRPGRFDHNQRGRSRRFAAVNPAAVRK